MIYWVLEPDLDSASYVVFVPVNESATWPVRTLTFDLRNRTFFTFNARPGQGGAKLDDVFTARAVKLLTPEQYAHCIARSL